MDNKLGLSLGLIPNLMSTLTCFFVAFSFRFPQKDGTIPRNKCQLSAYESSLQTKAVMLSLLHSLLQGRSQAEARPSLLSRPLRASLMGHCRRAIRATVTLFRCQTVLCTSCGWQGFRPEHPTVRWSVVVWGKVMWGSWETLRNKMAARAVGRSAGLSTVSDSHRGNEKKSRKSRMEEEETKAV